MEHNEFFEPFDENAYLATFYGLDAETLPNTIENNEALHRKQVRDETYTAVKNSLDENFLSYLTIGLTEHPQFSLYAVFDIKDRVMAADLKDALSDAMFSNKFVASTVFQAITRYHKLMAEKDHVYEFDPVKFRRSLTDKVRSHPSFPECTVQDESDEDFYRKAYAEALVEQIDINRDVEDDFFINWEAPFFFDNGYFDVKLRFYNHVGKSRKHFSYDDRKALVAMCEKYGIKNEFSKHEPPML